MADPAGEAVRSLRFPPTPKWGPYGPATKTLREDIARWYEPAGGIDTAINSAREAMKKTDLPFSPWSVADLDKQVPLVREQMPPQRLGEYDPGSQVIRLNRSGAPTQYTLEHERSHSVFGPDQYFGDSLSDTGSRFAGATDTQYITRPQEIDVRLANIKRHYAYNTGRIVDTPEEAERALRWWGRHSDKFEKTVPEAERPPFSPKAEAGSYLLLPEEQKQKVLRRMPELVDTNLIERLGQYG